jgi:dienelactone hydrolase
MLTPVPNAFDNIILSTRERDLAAVRASRPIHGYKGETGTAFQNYRKVIEQKARELLAIRATPSSFQVRKLWEKEAGWGTYEKLVYEADQEIRVPAYIARPPRAKGKLPVIICLQGHSTGMHRSLGIEAGDEMTPLTNPRPGQDIARQCLARGYAALCIEQRAFGERMDASLPHMEAARYPNCVESAVRCLGLGQTLLGNRVYDIVGALDLIKKDSGLDEKRVAIMGNSTGGTVAMAAAALFPDQIHAVMPSSSFYPNQFTFERVRRCLCAYVPGMLQSFDIDDLAGLIAPRPLIILAGTADGLSNPWVVESFARLQKIYAASGEPGNCQLVTVEGGGHRFHEKEGWPVFEAVFPN